MTTTDEKRVNGLDTTVFINTIGEIKKNPELAQCQFRVRNQWQSCDDNRSEAHDFYAALNGEKIEKMESTYEGDLDLQGLLGLAKDVRPGFQEIRVNFKINTSAPKEHFEKYYHYSPVYDVVSKSVSVPVKIETD